MDEQIRNALKGEEVVIDITTTGRRSGQSRRVEIWFHNIDGRIIITGTPGPRSWLANLAVNPKFTFHLKGTVRADLPARARLITDPDERRAIMSAPETGWYRDQVGGIEPLAKGSPMLDSMVTWWKPSTGAWGRSWINCRSWDSMKIPWLFLRRTMVPGSKEALGLIEIVRAPPGKVDCGSRSLPGGHRLFLRIGFPTRRR